MKFDVVELLKHEESILNWSALLMITIGCIVFIILLFIPATYGRYSSTGRFYSLAIPARLAWFLQELPAFAVTTICIFLSKIGFFQKTYDNLQLLVLSCFVFHYFQRTFIYSLLISGGKPTPLYAFLLATIFCTVNGYMQARGALLISTYPPTVFTTFRVIVGMTLFVCGMVVNIHSDYILRNLRRPGETGYKIPTGGFFNFVSCANFFGEIIEWFGFAVASSSSVSFAFSFFTFANLVPRALMHHRWYVEKFEDYPKNRKAVLPGLL